MMKTSSMRKGITPVVAIVLLLLLTISAAGAAFAFSQNLIEERTAEGRQQAAAELTIRDISCNGVDDVTIDASNDGNVNLNDASVFAYWVSNNTLVDQQTSSGNDWAAGNFSSHDFNGFDNNHQFQSGPYRIEIRFDNVNYETSGQCDGV